MPVAAVVAAPTAPAASEAMDAEASPGDEVQAIIVAADFLARLWPTPQLLPASALRWRATTHWAPRARWATLISARFEDNGSLESAIQELLLWVRRERKMDEALLDKLA